jgi:hypothetical protein
MVGLHCWLPGHLDDNSRAAPRRQCLYRHPYPVGYWASKQHFGHTYDMRIEAGGEAGPAFVVEQRGGPKWTGPTRMPRPPSRSVVLRVPCLMPILVRLSSHAALDHRLPEEQVARDARVWAAGV